MVRLFCEFKQMAEKIKLKLKKNVQDNLSPIFLASKNRKIANPNLFDELDENKWELAYQQVMDTKYAKGSRNYSKKIQGNEWIGQGQPPIYVIPRQRGGPSYKKQKLQGIDAEDLHYALISKGFPMQDLSSFTLGPIVGEGLCLVNAAFSKCICVEHIEGGGGLDLGKKNFWKRSNKPERLIQVIDTEHMLVDNDRVNINQWLSTNQSLWFNEWDKWRKTVALCGLGDFHWIDNSECISFYHKGQFLDFVNWKIECYVRPSYQILSSNQAFIFLQNVLDSKRALGLVHPEGMSDEIIKPLTKEYIKELFYSKTEMSCQPYVVAGKLLGVEI